MDESSLVASASSTEIATEGSRYEVGIHLVQRKHRVIQFTHNSLFVRNLVVSLCAFLFELKRRSGIACSTRFVHVRSDILGFRMFVGQFFLLKGN